MPTARTKPPFRADHLGSLIRTPQLIAARDAWAAGTLPYAELRKLEDACIADAVAMQERVGIQSITDGELRRWSWRDGFFESVDGYTNERFESDFTFTEFSGERRKGMPVPRVVGKLKRRKTMTADDFADLLPIVPKGRTAKATLPSPSVTHFFRGDDMIKGSPYGSRAAYLDDVCAIYREEVADLARLGCTYLQIDEVPCAVLCDPRNQALVKDRGEDADALIDEYITAINAAVRDRPAGMTVCVHLCRGNLGHGQASGGYEPIAERLFNDLAVDGYFLEYDTDRSGDFRPLRHLPKDKLVVLGLVSTKLSQLEPPADLKRRIEEASRYVDVDRLCLSPQCGFSSGYKTLRFTPADQERKLAHVVKVAADVWG
jgi:5-methyltetrahydropteroyltriglutamate--homocysteine methyltransferase